MKQKQNTRFALLPILLLLVFFSFIFAYMSVTLHSHFQSFGWDLGFFDQIIWKVSQGDLVAFSTLAKENLLADHFQVVLYFLAPLYLLKSDITLILIAQAILIVFAGFPLYLTAKKMTGNVFLSLSVSLAYLLFLGTQWTILNEFHQTAFAPIFLSLFYLGMSSKDLRWMILGIIGLFITKEEFSLLVASLGFVVWFGYKKKVLGISTFLAGAIMFFVLIYVLMPALSVEGKYHHMGFGAAGHTPVDVIKTSIGNPSFFINQMISPSIKIKTVFDSFFAFGFLPLFSPIFLIPVIEQFVTRFIYAGPQFTQWANVNHHAAPLGTLLSIGTIYAVLYIANIISKKTKLNKNKIFTYIGVYIVLMSVIQNIVLHGPINSFLKPQFHERYPWMDDNEKIIKLVPRDIPISTQNSLFPHLSQRNEIYLFPEIENAQYLVFDMVDGPNKFSPLKKDEVEQSILELQIKKEFSIYAQIGQAIILKRN